MVQPRALSLLSSAERHLLRQNRTYARQYRRCINTSKPAKAEETTGNDQSTPYNAPNRGPNRQERAAKVSSEVAALAADLPKANLKGRNAEAHGAQKKNPDVSPQSQVTDAGPGRMGENDGPRKEGPFTQGVGRVVRESEEDPSYSKEARGIRTPNGKMETPAEGGASVMDPMGTAAHEVPVSSDPNTSTAEASAAATAQSTNSKPVAPAEATSPSKHAQTAEQYLHGGYGTSTLLRSNILGMIQDRANLLAPRSSPSTPATSEIAYRLRHHPKKLTAFRSQAEKDAFVNTPRRLELSGKIKELKVKLAEEQKKNEGADPTVITQLKKQLFQNLTEMGKSGAFLPLPSVARRSIINRIVKGKFNLGGVLSGHEQYQQPALNTVARELLKNPTYLAKDSAMLIGKLQDLLPSAAAAPAATKKPAAKAKA
jgi:hypothetical protein